MNSIEKANETSIYFTLTLAVMVGMVGVFFRFLHDSTLFSVISWVIFILGWAIALRAVFRILQ